MMMTKLKEILISIMAIILIALFVVAGFYMQDKSTASKAELAQLYAKREDLLSQQQKLDALLTSLNQTLVAEIARQQNLSNELTNLTGQKANLIAANNQVVVAPPVVNTTPAPVVITPKPKPVTRAS